MVMAPLRVAVEGCCHGELDAIYKTLTALEKKDGKKIDLLICCGDFQSVRNLDDLECMSCPPKYREIRTFYKYYSGELRAPVPTLFIGGNHEASNYLLELFYGGWVAPDIYYLGAAGVIDFGGLRIGGLSGTYAARDYGLPHHERPPYTSATLRSTYHIRASDVHRLASLATAPDVMLSHDWPQGIARHGDLSGLLRRKTFLRAEIEDNSLGSPPAWDLLRRLRPAYWFSAHMHTKFAAVVRHPAVPSSADSAKTSESEPAAEDQAADAPPKLQLTRFLSLDKCLPRRQFLQVLEFPEAQGPRCFSYDPDWCAVLRRAAGTAATARHSAAAPARSSPTGPVTDEEVAAAAAALRAASGDDSLRVPNNFQPTAPCYDPGARGVRGRMPLTLPRNPQTTALLATLGVDYDVDLMGSLERGGAAPPQAQNVIDNPEEIALDDGADDDDHTLVVPALTAVFGVTEELAPNPEEIDIDLGEE